MTTALEMDTETPSGIYLEGALWVMAAFCSYPLARRAEIHLVAYRDQDALDAGLEPIASRSYDVSGPDFDALQNATITDIAGWMGASKRKLRELVTAAALRYVQGVADVIETQEGRDPKTGQITTAETRRSFFSGAKSA